MDPKHLDELVRLEETYWWHVAKRELVKSLLSAHFAPPGTLVEGGVGSGRNLLEFRKLGYDVVGFDIMPEAVEHAKRHDLSRVQQHDLAQPWPLEEESVSAVVMLDVLEHTEDPVQVLRNAHRVLRPGGGIVLTVPAHPWLFCEWDRKLGHYRRYTGQELQAEAQAAELNVTHQSYWNAFSLPPAIALRTVQRLFPRERNAEFPRVSPRMNALLLKLAAWERWFQSVIGMPTGLSLVGVLRK